MKLSVITNLNSALTVKPYVIDKPQVDIITLMIPVSPFYMMDGGFNKSFAGDVNRAIKYCVDKGKQVGLQFHFGNNSGNWIFNKYPNLLFKEKRWQGDPQPVRIPCFWHQDSQNEFVVVNEIQSFFSNIYQSLYNDKKVWYNISHIGLTGLNQATAEWRMPDEDYTGKGDPHHNAATKYLDNGYTVKGITEASKKLFDFMFWLFSPKILDLSIIAGLNGFPCISEDGTICEPDARPFITGELITYVSYAYPGSMIQSNSLGAHGGTPFEVLNSGASQIGFQVNSDKYGGGLKQPYPDINPVIENAKEHLKGENDIFEVFETTMFVYYWLLA